MERLPLHPHQVRSAAASSPPPQLQRRNDAELFALPKPKEKLFVARTFVLILGSIKPALVDYNTDFVPCLSVYVASFCLLIKAQEKQQLQMNSSKRCRADHQVQCQRGIRTVRCQDGGHFFFFFLSVWRLANTKMWRC